MKIPPSRISIPQLLGLLLGAAFVYLALAVPLEFLLLWSHSPRWIWAVYDTAYEPLHWLMRTFPAVEAIMNRYAELLGRLWG